LGACISLHFGALAQGELFSLILRYKKQWFKLDLAWRGNSLA
jgi:hypothetical protein